MRIKRDFVTNSSSTSFIIDGTHGYSVKDIARGMLVDMRAYEMGADGISLVSKEEILEKIPDDADKYLDLAISFIAIEDTLVFRVNTDGKEKEIRGYFVDYPPKYDWNKKSKEGLTYRKADSLGVYTNPILIATSRNFDWASLYSHGYQLGEDYCYLIDGLSGYLNKDFVHLDNKESVDKFLEKLNKLKKEERSWWLSSNIVDLNKLYEDLLED